MTEPDFNRWRRQFQSGEQAAQSAHAQLIEKDAKIDDLQWSLDHLMEKVEGARKS